MPDLQLALRYEQIARTLPLPSAAQRACFLEHMPRARPWPMWLPADGGVPFTLFLNPRAGLPAGPAASNAAPGAAQAYRAAFGHLDYSAPLAASAAPDEPAGQPFVLDEQARPVELPPDLLAAATCALNATLHPDPALLLETLPLRVPHILDAGADQLAPIADDAELRAFAEEYTREELGGFVCPTDREAWASRWLEAFQRLYAPRHAEQLARLERALDGLLAWAGGIDKA